MIEPQPQSPSDVPEPPETADVSATQPAQASSKSPGPGLSHRTQDRQNAPLPLALGGGLGQEMSSILLVDDTPDNLRLLVEILIQQGYRVRPVMEGKRAIAAAQLSPPDLVLLDIKMPDLDGYQVCQALKADPRTENIPVIFLTVLDDSVDKVKGFDLGGIDYITKPFDAAELLARVENHLRIRQLQNQLSEREAFLRSVYDGLEAAVSVLDLEAGGQFRIAGVNQTFVEMSGIRRDRLIGAALQEFVPEAVIQRHHRVCAETGQARTVEEFLVVNGQDTWWLATHTPLLNDQGEVYRLIGTSLNITDRKGIELRLAQQRKILTQTLEELRETQGKLVEAAKMAALGNLVAGIAHEINTPLGVAITAASTLVGEVRELKRECDRQLPQADVLEDYLGSIEECTGLVLGNLDRAGELVQSFKRVAVDQVSLQERTFGVKSYLQEVILNLKPQLKLTPHRIELTGDDDCLIHSYPGALSQVVTNLVLNSLAHGFVDGQSGQIWLEVQAEEESCLLRYRDNGVGILPENIDRIFEPFFTTARHAGGSGLGLHLVYNLVTQRLQGAIAVTSEPGQGVEFVITLPKELTLVESGSLSNGGSGPII
jgi:PAS domain S-box-containing protein